MSSDNDGYPRWNTPFISGTTGCVSYNGPSGSQRWKGINAIWKNVIDPRRDPRPGKRFEDVSTRGLEKTNSLNARQDKSYVVANGDPLCCPLQHIWKRIFEPEPLEE